MDKTDELFRLGLPAGLAEELERKIESRRLGRLVTGIDRYTDYIFHNHFCAIMSYRKEYV